MRVCTLTQPKLFVSHTQIGTQTHHCNRVGKKRRGRWIVIFLKLYFGFHRLELAILTLQKKEPMVSQVYDLLHLVWKTYHFSGKSKRELHHLGKELGVDVCTPSTVKGTRWIPHVHRALKVFLRHGADKNLATDNGQYSTVLQHMEHLAVAGTVEVQGRAKKVSFTTLS